MIWSMASTNIEIIVWPQSESKYSFAYGSKNRLQNSRLQNRYMGHA